MKILFLLSLMLLSGLAIADGVGWRDKAGNQSKNTDDMQSKNDFGGWVIITSDGDWQKKWNTSSDVTPHFTTAKEVSVGSSATILTFFGNPAVDSEGNIDILCDLKIIRPDGTKSADQKGIQCAEGKLYGSPYNTRLTAAVIKISAEKTDQMGLWVVEVNLTDNLKKVTLALKSSFIMKE